MRSDPAAAFRAWSSYRGAPAATRAFLAARLAVIPLGELDAVLRSLKGDVLSLGAGHGVLERYLAEINPEVAVDGYELEEARVRVAEATRAGAPRVTIVQADVTRLPAGTTYDAALAVDVLHHLPPEQHAVVAAALHRLVRPGGRVVVKDIATRPRWKHRWNAIHDRLVAGPAPVHCRAPGDMAAVFASAGFDVDRAGPIGRWSPYPHYLLVVTRRP